MSNQHYDKMKKEVIANILGTTIGIRLQGNSPILFKQFYYDSIANDEERRLIGRILLEILSKQSVTSRYKLKCYSAYIASDIDLKEAIPFVEKLASEKSIQKSSLILLLERALEKLKSDYTFSREQMKHIVICQIKGSHHDVHTRGEILYDFKQEYFETSTLQKKDMIRQAIMDILTTDSTYLDWKRLRCYAAYIASDIDLTIAKPVIEIMLENEYFKKSKDYWVLLRALDKFDNAQF